MRILYLMHVDWHWVKQRPHFLAERLSVLPDLKVLIAYPRVFRRASLIKNPTAAKLLPMLMLPFSRFKWIAALNEQIRILYFLCLIRLFKPSVVWVTFPTIVPSCILDGLQGIQVVYDCMDDAPAFRSSEFERRSILAAEKTLLDRADLVLTSSQHLFQTMIERGARQDKLRLVRNALGGILHPPSPSRQPGTIFRFLYIGTVAEYIDFDLIIHCLTELDGIEFHFVGPVTAQHPYHERLIFHGPVEHAHLFEFSQAYDCFTMPFKVTELIRGVDPVKLYEYINFNKNVLCIHYPELDRFADFVTFYRTQSEFVERVRALAMDNRVKYQAGQRLQFLLRNTWAVRADDIVKYLRSPGMSQAPDKIYVGRYQ